MKFSTQTTYGLRAVLRLAKEKNASLALSSIANEEKISQKYLEKLFSKLKKAGIVTSEKGASGGYRLANDPSLINLFDVINALEGKFSPFHCNSKGVKIYCTTKCNCDVNIVLNKIQESIKMSLSSINLKELI